jgi:IS5 family transposase
MPNSSTGIAASCAFLRIRFGRLMRDIRRKIAGHADLEAAFAWPLSCAGSDPLPAAAPARLEVVFVPRSGGGVHRQGQGYEFGVKASIVTTNARAPGGQFVLHARALPGNPYDGHTLGAIIEATERLTGREIERAYVDTAATMPQTHAASSSQAKNAGSLSQAKNAGSLAASNASSDGAPRSRR